MKGDKPLADCLVKWSVLYRANAGQYIMVMADHAL